jgi:hypothetical protein
MTSWRDTTSEPAQAELDGLVGAALGMAQHLLSKNHEFYPFGAAVEAGNVVEFIAGRSATDGDEHPSPQAVLEGSEAVLRARRHRLRAAALVSDVRTPDGEAVQVDLEHVEGAALRILLPYTRHRLGRVKEYGELRAEAGTRRVWA